VGNHSIIVIKVTSPRKHYKVNDSSSQQYVFQQTMIISFSK